MKQEISIRNMALRDALEEESHREEQARDHTNQHQSLTHSIDRLRVDIKYWRAQIKDKRLSVPSPDFSLHELEGGDEE